jgi:hypothetical protein
MGRIRPGYRLVVYLIFKKCLCLSLEETLQNDEVFSYFYGIMCLLEIKLIIKYNFR